MTKLQRLRCKEIQAEPGLWVRDWARRWDITPAAVYRLVRRIEKESGRLPLSHRKPGDPGFPWRDKPKLTPQQEAVYSAYQEMKADGVPPNGALIGERLGLTRERVRQHILRLQEKGYDVSLNDHHGVVMAPRMTDQEERRLRQAAKEEGICVSDYVGRLVRGALREATDRN